MKGPNVRHTLDVRRTWVCPQCGRRRKAPGQETQQICRCVGGGQFSWMKLDEPRRVARPETSFAVPLTETADEAEARMGPDPNPPPPPPPSPTISATTEPIVEGAVTDAESGEADFVAPDGSSPDGSSPEASKGSGRRDRDRGNRRAPDRNPRVPPPPRTNEDSSMASSTSPTPAPAGSGQSPPGAGPEPNPAPTAPPQPVSDDAFGAGL